MAAALGPTREEMVARMTWADRIDRYGLEITLAAMKAEAEQRMRKIDRMPAYQRALVHEYGFSMVSAALARLRTAKMQPRKHLARVLANSRSSAIAAAMKEGGT